MGWRSKHPFFWFVILYGALVTATFVAVAITIYRYGSLTLDLGWRYECRQDKCFVKDVDPQGPAADKLQAGDQIVAVNHDAQVARIGVWSESLLALEPVHSFVLTIQRGTSEREVSLYANYHRDIHRLVSILVLFLAACITLECALWIGLLKPDLRTTQLFTLTWLWGCLIQVLPAMKLMQPFFGPMELRLISCVWFLAMSPLSIATGFHFCYRFPPGIPESRGWSVIKYALYFWTGSLALFFTVTRLLLLFDPREGAQFIFYHYPLFRGLERIIPLSNVVLLPAISAVLARNYHILRDPDQRRRIRWVVYGSILGTLPFVFYSLVTYFDRTTPLQNSVAVAQHDNLFLIANFALVLLPFTSAYAIVKNRMFDVRVIVRKGVRYLFARKMLQAFIYAPLILILFAVRAHRDRPILDVLFSNSSYILMLAAAVGGLLFRKNLLEGLDRKFFREAYDSERILLNLADEIKNFSSMPEVAEWVSSQLGSALHPKEIFVYYRRKERGDFVLGYSSSENMNVQTIPEQTEWLRVLELEEKSQNFASSDRHVLPQAERDWLQKMGIHLVVPMLGSDHRIKGALLLGEKRSEEPYSAADRRLLEALSGQMAILHENLLLKDRVDQGDRVQRDVLAHLASEKRNLLKECPTCGTCYDSSVEVCKEDGTELTLTLPVERTVDGKYRLNALIGKGGMGAVYRATDIRLAREIALKIMMGSMFGNSHAVRRFEREARASARLQHPNIITIYDFGGIGEGAYLAMELLDGYTLRSTLEQSGNLSPALAAKWFDQILEGVKAAHQLGVIHRDLKPENIFITRGQKNLSILKILDFGLAKMKANDASQSSASLTAPGTAMGTLHYMSPEQITAGDIDERTDVFSLGVMVIEALTGRLPFDGKTSTEVALSILQKKYHLEGDSPDRKLLDSVIQKCIAKNRNDRYASISEMQKHLIDAVAQVTAFPTPPRSADVTETDSFYL